MATLDKQEKQSIEHFMQSLPEKKREQLKHSMKDYLQMNLKPEDHDRLKNLYLLFGDEDR
jgi:DNA-binding TFAR19-related protein (PDSD5 family)